MKSFVLCSVPRAGLGNQLLTWAKAVAYGKRHGLEVLHWGWSVPSATRTKRIFRGNETWLSMMRGSPLLRVAWQSLLARRCERVVEPAQAVQPKAENMVCEFHRVPPWQDYFGDFRDQRDHVLAELHRALHPNAARIADSTAPPYVVAHLRMGDFTVVKEGVDFAMVGQHRTPFAYFESAVAGIRYYAGWRVPVHLASDGSAAELAPLMAAVEDVTLMPQRPAMADLLWMSKARVIICSAGSTFSSWAGFLGEAALMHHPAHTPVPIRGADIGERRYDGAAVEDWYQWPELLQHNLRAIRLH